MLRGFLLEAFCLPPCLLSPALSATLSEASLATGFPRVGDRQLRCGSLLLCALYSLHLCSPRWSLFTAE